ncbi:MAG: hypothetical protein BWX80_04175 [Candidatus Hydrogenedentes bacterium ADurb.Bin101]|nr:MAG: hypothetical protein BWX80_04175 [Candidatus Hydrogenedentes bacterium ADurb.Bin101]
MAVPVSGYQILQSVAVPVHDGGLTAPGKGEFIISGTEDVSLCKQGFWPRAAIFEKHDAVGVIAAEKIQVAVAVPIRASGFGLAEVILGIAVLNIVPPHDSYRITVGLQVFGRCEYGTLVRAGVPDEPDKPELIAGDQVPGPVAFPVNHIHTAEALHRTARVLLHQQAPVFVSRHLVRQSAPCKFMIPYPIPIHGEQALVGQVVHL